MRFLAFSTVAHAFGQENPQQIQIPTLLSRPIVPQATWGLFSKQKEVKVIDVLSVLSRFSKREDFYIGKGYRRPEQGLLSREVFYENISKLKVKRVLKDKNGKPFGFPDQPEKDLLALLGNTVPTQEAADAVFTSFAKGATNGVAYPKQVDEEMERWLSPDGTFDLSSFQSSLAFGKFYVALGWFLYIGLQFGGVYVVFFVPIMSQFFPEVDFYPVQTFLHTSEWGK